MLMAGMTTMFMEGEKNQNKVREYEETKKTCELFVERDMYNLIIGVFFFFFISTKHL